MRSLEARECHERIKEGERYCLPNLRAIDGVRADGGDKAVDIRVDDGESVKIELGALYV